MSPKSPVQQIGDRLRALRKAKKLSQYSFRKRVGLLQPYISRIENGRNTPVGTFCPWRVCANPIVGCC